MKNGKEEKLSELFSAYTSEEKSPDISATSKAKEYMNKTRVAEKATVAAVETAGGSSVGSDAGLNNRKKTLITVAVALFLIAFAIVCYHVANKRGGGACFSSSALKTVEITEDNVTSTNYEYKDFLPFIESEYVERYAEYKLKNSEAGYKKGDIVAYYVKVNITENEEIADTEFEIYVELPRVKVRKLEEYKNAPKSRKIENIVFYYGSEGGDAYYFVHSEYGYNLKFIKSDDKTAVLTYIAGKFTT